jgi:hypothetical protein
VVGTISDAIGGRSRRGGQRRAPRPLDQPDQRRDAHRRDGRYRLSLPPGSYGVAATTTTARRRRSSWRPPS